MKLIKQTYKIKIEVSEDLGDLTEEIKDLLESLKCITYEVERLK